MVFRFRERHASRESTRTPPTLTAHYVASGTGDEAYVRAYSLAQTPPIWPTDQGILYRQDIRIDAVGRDIWNVAVPYGKHDRAAGKFRLSFDTTGGTLHIKVAKETKGRYKAIGDSDPPDHKGAIGVHGDEVDGTDIVVPALKLTVTFTHPAAIITLPQIKNFARYTGKTNSDTFLTFAPGEVLFLGCKGEEGIEVESQVAYDYACSENLADQVISGITVAQKRGWDVSWIAFKDDVDGGKAAKPPRYIYVERVYDEIPMALAFGFGG
jgi:hypothetical protein